MCPEPLMKRRITWGWECIPAPRIDHLVNQRQRHSENLSVFKSGTGTKYYNGLKKHSILHFMTIFWSKPLWSVQYVFLSLLLQRMNVCTQQCDQNEVISMLPMAPQQLKAMQMIMVMLRFFFCSETRKEGDTCHTYPVSPDECQKRQVWTSGILVWWLRLLSLRKFWNNLKSRNDRMN